MPKNNYIQYVTRNAYMRNEKFVKGAGREG